MNIQKALFASLIVTAAILLAACDQAPQGTPQAPAGQSQTSASFEPGTSLQAQTFSSVEELQSFLRAHQSSNAYYGAMLKSAARPGVAMDATAETVAAPAPAAGTTDYSGTNNQVAGIDEGDILKTDGEYIYTVSGSTLFIINATPAKDAAVISRMSFEKGAPQGLFIQGDDLVVYGMVSDYSLLRNLSIPSGTSMTYLEVYDTSDKEHPSLVKDYLFEGSYSESRLKDGFVYLVTQDYPQYSPRPLPLIAVDGVVKDVPLSSIRYYPIPYDSVSYVTINAISLSSLEHDSKTLAVEGSSELYMSKENIYLSYTKSINEWEITQEETLKLVKPRLSEADQSLIKKIEAVDEDVLSRGEKEQKVMEIVSRYVQYLPSEEQDALQEEIDQAVERELEGYDHYEYTIIHRVAIDGLSITPQADAELPGHLNNQFSMDEHDGTLRVATTLSPHWSSIKGKQTTESENMVYTLDHDLKVIDSLEGIAKGESIYSTRFIGDRLYMVTFEQTDPFFVIDLSDPSDIKTLGELKLPGFSRYLHPYDEDHVIGLGRDATETGRQQGLKISVFDVSDVSDPKETASWTSKEKYASSAAEYEHKAFLFSKDKGLLVIPAYSYEYKDGDYEGYNGALVFNISAHDIELRGLIDHSKDAQNRWAAAVERSLYIGDDLYTKSYALLRINALDDLHSVKNVTLEPENESDMPVY